MPVVTCPSCASRYDPNVPDVDPPERQTGPIRISFKVVCPVCSQWVRLPQNEAIDGPSLSETDLKEMMAQCTVIERGDVGPAEGPRKKPKRF